MPFDDALRQDQQDIRNRGQRNSVLAKLGVPDLSGIENTRAPSIASQAQQQAQNVINGAKNPIATPSFGEHPVMQAIGALNPKKITIESHQPIAPPDNQKPIPSPAPLVPQSPLSSDQNELQRLKTTGSGVSQIKNPVLKGIAGIGDVIGSSLFPGIARNIPGTTAHHQLLMNQAEGNVKNDLGNEKEQAQIEQEQAHAKQMQNPKPEKAENPEGQVFDILNDPNSTPEQKQAAQDALEKIKNAGKPDTEKGTVHDSDQGLIWVKPDGSATPLTLNGQPLMGKPKPDKQVNTSEDLKSRIAEAFEKGDKATVTKLQNELKAIDPEGAQRLQIQIDSNQDKKTAVEDKKNEAYNHVIDLQKEAEEYVKNPTGPGDVALTLAFVEATRPKAGFRMTQTEWNQIIRARAMGGLNPEVMIKKVEAGEMLSPEQRQQMKHIIDMSADIARSHIGGKSDNQEGAPKVGDEKTFPNGKKGVWDGQGWVAK